MAATIVTIEDLMEFKTDLISEIQKLFSTEFESKKDTWIKTPELKKWLGLSHGTVQQLRINGTFPYSKIGGIIYYNKTEIEQIFIKTKIHNK